MWRDPLEDLIEALEKVVDVSVGGIESDRELSVEYVEQSFLRFQLETDAILFGTREALAQPTHNGLDDRSDARSNSQDQVGLAIRFNGGSPQDDADRH